MGDKTPYPFRLRLLGAPCAVDPDNRVLTGRAAQRHRLGLLALLALAPDPGVHRDKAVALLWPEHDALRGHHLLRQAVYIVRAALGPDAIITASDRIRLNPDRVGVDVRDFDSAMERADHPAALALYRGPFLDGFFLSDAPEFERWVEGERQRLAGSYRRALEALARSAEAAGDHARALESWRALAAQDPLDTRVAMHVAAALDAEGNHAGALQFAAEHAQLVRDELGMEPPAELTALIENLRLGKTARRREPDPATPGQSQGTNAVGDPARPRPVAAHRDKLRHVAVYATVAILAITVTITLVRSRRGVSSEIAREAAPTLGSGGQPESPQYLAAHELYLRGSDPALMRSDSGVQQRLHYFERAVALDSTYGVAYSALAATYVRMTMSDHAGLGARELQTRAEVAAARGVALADSTGGAHQVLGLVRMRGHDFAAAEDEFRQAIALDPREASGHESLAGLYLVTGRPREGLAEARQALDLDPLSSAAIAELAHALLFNGRCDEALTQLARIASVRPPLLRAAPIAAQCYAAQHRWAMALAVLQPQQDRDPVSLALSGYMLARAGRREQALRVEATLLEQWRQRHEGAEHVAEVYAGLGDLDQAFAWLDRALDDGTLVLNPWYGEIMEPVFQQLQRDPRFHRARERLDLPSR